MRCNEDKLPSNEEIHDIVNRAKTDSVMLALSLGMSVCGDEWLKPIIKDIIIEGEISKKKDEVSDEEKEEKTDEEDPTKDYLETRMICNVLGNIECWIEF